MDDNRYRFPRFTMDDSLQSRPSYWPLSHIRSSMGERDMSPEGDTFDRHWLEDEMAFIPFQERTIKNLTGRSLQESLASFDRNLRRDYPDPPPEAPLAVRECSKNARDGYPYFLYGEHHYPLAKGRRTSKVASDMESDAAAKSKPRQKRSSRTPELSDEVSSMVLDERDAIHQHSICAAANRAGGDQNMIVDKLPKKANSLMDMESHPKVTGHTSSTTSQHRVIRQPPTPTSPKGTTTAIAHPSSVPHPSMSICNILNYDMHQIRTPEPPTVPQPISQMVMDKQSEKHCPSEESIRRLPHRQSAPTSFHVEQSEEDDDPTDSFHETFNPSSASAPAKPKAKQKVGEQGSHICKICNISFTRNFDLQRHNQRHKEETDEDKARRTCTNCNRLLSRVDATKRHVDTLPDSCNHIRKKEGKMMLPPMPQSHYDTCKAKYYKLAQETKKPKGRKKAVAVP